MDWKGFFLPGRGYKWLILLILLIPNFLTVPFPYLVLLVTLPFMAGSTISFVYATISQLIIAYALFCVFSWLESIGRRNLIIIILIVIYILSAIHPAMWVQGVF